MILLGKDEKVTSFNFDKHAKKCRQDITLDQVNQKIM